MPWENCVTFQTLCQFEKRNEMYAFLKQNSLLQHKKKI